MRKNRFLTFMFSIIPGCGHMYLGYMKRGVEFMAMFAASAYFAAMFINFYRGFEMLGATFMVFLPIIWLYQMFDSTHTISQMKRLEIEFPEDDGFFIPGVSNITNLDALKIFKRPNVIKTIAIIIICVGAYMLFMNTSNGLFQILLESVRNNYRKQEMYRETYNTIMRYIPPVIISILLIFGGIKLLKDNKNNKNDNNAETE